ncbi:DUF4198 domain-containing protein [Pollutimonas sp. M17]|uniref:DUF4198 domain-containing protein n=1 Tax=Pollutimonas sp. M17 TaxID=2962065 RepID=UPI0021F3F711|nr:DUF4198 domain-containing protein [Pollutimonas sp. M17]UYO92733.1 DUF4198 domain-containing protein [Pollutimonas sp. M17]
MMKQLALPLLAFSLLLSPFANAHDAWILPSATTLSGEKAWITVDAAAGNDKFYFNHRPLNLNGLQIVSPRGASLKGENVFSGELRSGFDLQLTETGTYRIALVRSGVSAQWKQDGKPKRWFGPSGEFAGNVPQDASGLKVQERSSRIETFVTKGKPSSISDVKEGIGLLPVTHPNDLFVGEPAQFIMTVDGRPAKQAKVHIVPEGSRYRDELNAIELTADDAGKIEVTWPHAGRYWLSMEASGPATDAAPAGTRSRQMSYSATLEVLPQ